MFIVVLVNKPPGYLENIFEKNYFDFFGISYIIILINIYINNRAGALTKLSETH